MPVYRGRLWRSLSAFLSAILSGFTLLSAFLSAQKSKTTQKRALKSKSAFLSAQKSAQTSGFAQNSAQLRSFTQKRAQLSGPLKKVLKRAEYSHTKEGIGLNLVSHSKTRKTTITSAKLS